MRFLLHPRRSALGRASGVLSKPAAVTVARPPALFLNEPKGREPPAPNATSTVAVPVVDRRLSSRIPPSTTSVPAHVPDASRRRAWGQQCSEHCGCVVRFEAEIRDGTVESARYHAKQLVLSRPGTTGPSSHPAPVLTTKGRLMFKPCECSALHHLSGAVVDHMVGAAVSRLKNSLEFRSTRSSPAFRSAALRAQGLSASSDSKCFDLVEEAVTALLKGHMPQPRRPIVVPRPVHPRTPRSDPDDSPKNPVELPRPSCLEAHGDHNDYSHHDDDDEQTFPNVFWRSPSSRHVDDANPSGLSSTSTLRLLDLENEDRSSLVDASNALVPSSHVGRPLGSHADADNNRRRDSLRGRIRRGVPRDWVSYVDEIHWRHESSA